MTRRAAVLLFGGLATMWGLSFPAISVGLRDLPPLLFAAFRYDVAAVLLLVYVGATADPGDHLPSEGRDVVAVLAGGVFLVAANGLLFIGQQTVPSGVAAILQGLVPILTTLGTVCWPTNRSPFAATRNTPPARTATTSRPSLGKWSPGSAVAPTYTSRRTAATS